jgi:hypothetical protein
VVGLPFSEDNKKYFLIHVILREKEIGLLIVTVMKLLFCMTRLLDRHSVSSSWPEGNRTANQSIELNV